LRLVTLAPELEGSEALIRLAVASGTRVSVGHSLANYKQVMEAFAAGATLSTHLGNAVPNLLPRHDNTLVAQLASPLDALFIPDGQHLPEAFARLILQAKGLERCIATSDGAPPAGLPPGVYEFFGTKARVCEDGAIRNLNAPTLAGSSACLLDCLNFLAGKLSLPEESLWLLGRDNPLKALGLGTRAAALPELVEFSAGRFRPL
jgi:N-acetylglucosamine-6-phosphate deacetylase